MRYVVVCFSIGFALSSLAGCSQAIPTVTTLSDGSKTLTPSNVDDTEPSINSGGGEMTSGSFKIFGKIGPSPVVMQGPGFRIHTSGDN